jgi:hypothetical protein
MLDRLSRRAERIGADAALRAKRRIAAGFDEPGITVSIGAEDVTLEGHRLSERLGWIGRLFR